MSIKLSRPMEEAYVWDAAAATKWAKGLKRWPKRRFRVEGSRAGNSRLVGEETAKVIRSKHGGQVVELIPPAKSIVRKSVYEVAAEDLGDCPRCKASADAPCVWPDGSRRYPHKKREQPRSAYEQAAQEFGKCPWCKAEPGEACTWRRGVQRLPHSRRIKESNA